MVLRATWKKQSLTTSDVLEHLFDDNSDFSGSESEGEGEEVYAYQGPTVTYISRIWTTFFQVSGFIAKVLYDYC